MKITVKDCLELEVFKNIKVVAGEKNLDARVKSVSVLESTELSHVKKHFANDCEMVLSGFFNAAADEIKQTEIIRTLAEAGTAALVLFYVDSPELEISKDVIATANRVGLPIIVMPKDKELKYSDVINQVMENVLYGDNFGNRLISNTIFHLLNFEKHSNFQSAIREAAINNDFQLILLSEDFNPILSIETRHKVSVQEAINMGRERDVDNKSSVYTMIDVNGVLTYWGPVMINNDKYFMFIVDNEDSYSAGEITKLAEIIELAMGMWKYTPERDSRAEFIKALRRGNRSLAYTLKDEAGISGEEILSAFYARGIDNEEGHKTMSMFEKEYGLGIMTIVEGDETYGVLIDSKNSTDETASMKRANCIALFNKLKEDKTVRIFHVTGVDGIEGIADAYRLISESWGFAQSVFPYKRVFTKYELALVSNCINIQLQGSYVKKNYLELLEPFKEAKENKGRQLLETLETFVLDAGMNSAKTSVFMGIHTNTVQYRLKKINEVLDVEITGNRVIPGLTIALALKRLERVVR